MESPSLERCKSHLDTVLSRVLLGDPAQVEGLDERPPEGSQSQTFCDTHEFSLPSLWPWLHVHKTRVPLSQVRSRGSLAGIKIFTVFKYSGDLNL